MLTIRQIGIIPSLERFVSTNYLLRHIVIFAILAALVVCASTVAYILVMHYGHPTNFPASDPRLGFQSNSGGRDTMDIISACASTLITCVYSSVHFNIPEGYAHRLRFGEKLQSRDFWLDLYAKVTFWLLGLFAPEMLVLHAYYEYMVAREDVLWMKQHGHQEWTMTHAFFADMGGFITEDNRVPHSGFELYDMIFRNEEPGSIDYKALEYDIADRTKVDMLFKILTTLQVCRFFVETIVRAIEALPISPLEIITCAYVICTLMYYGLWLQKPYNVNERIIVRVQLGIRRARRIAEPEIIGRTERSYWILPLRTFWLGLCSFFLEPRMTEADRLHGSTKMYQSSPYMPQGSLIAAIAGLIVGLAHLASWSVEFPNSNGQVLWRSCSIVLTVMPIVVSILIYGAAILRNPLVTFIMNQMVLTLTIVYCVARFILLILLGHSFQSLPAGVYNTETSGWLSNIPFFH